MESKTNNNGCISIVAYFVLALQAIFIILKLVKQIEWNWVWVLSPTIVFLGISGIIFVIIAVITMIVFFKTKGTIDKWSK